MLFMKTIASRVLAANPGKVWEDLEREGAVVITKDGVPRSILVPTSDATLLEDVQDLVFARARRAVRAIRLRASAAGQEPLTGSGIDQEIRAARRALKRKVKRD